MNYNPKKHTSHLIFPLYSKTNNKSQITVDWSSHNRPTFPIGSNPVLALTSNFLMALFLLYPRTGSKWIDRFRSSFLPSISCLLFQQSSQNVSRHVPRKSWNPKPLQSREVIVVRLKRICRHCNFCFRNLIRTPYYLLSIRCACWPIFAVPSRKVEGDLLPLESLSCHQNERSSRHVSPWWTIFSTKF